MRNGGERFHDKPGQDFVHGSAQRLTQIRKAATENDHLRMKQMNHVRQAKSQIFGPFAQDFLGCGILFSESTEQVLRFATRGGFHSTGQGAGWVRFDQFANSCIDGPTGATGFECGSSAIKAHMADLGFTRACAVIDLAIYDGAAPDAASERDVKTGVGTGASAMSGFPQGGDFGVVVQKSRHTRQFTQPASEVEFRPTFNLMGAADLSGFPVHGPAEANTNTLRVTGAN